MDVNLTLIVNVHRFAVMWDLRRFAVATDWELWMAYQWRSISGDYSGCLCLMMILTIRVRAVGWYVIVHIFIINDGFILDTTCCTFNV